MWDILGEINNIGKNTFLRAGIIETIINALPVLLSAFVISKILRKLILKHYKGNPKMILKIKNFIVYAFAIYGILNQFTAFSEIMRILLASTGVVTLAARLAAQDAVGNFVNGLMIIFFKPFKIGDLIRIESENISGTVEDIALRHTVVKTFENTRVIIPNSTMNSTVLENISLTNEQKANFLELDISYESDVDRAMSIISVEAAKHPNFLDIRTPNEIENGVPAVVVRITGFLDNSVHLRATLYSKNNSEGFAMLCDLRYTIKKRFDEENIEFPYPHRTIILKNETKQEEPDKVCVITECG